MLMQYHQPITLSFLLLCVARKYLNFTLSLQSKMGNLNIQDINDGANFSCNLNPLVDPEEFKRQGKMIIDFLADYYQNVEKYPVRSQVEPGYLRKLLPDSAPHNAEPIETILADVQNHIVPGLTHWQSPNFFAYFPCTGSIAGFLGEMLMTGFNVNPFSWMTSPAATELEGIVMDWVGKVLNLPQAFLFSGGGGGVIQATTCEAMLSTLCGARDKKLREIGRNNLDKLVVYASDQTHCSFQKAAQIAGIHPDNFRAIKTKRSEAFSLSPDSLRFVILSDVEAGLTPLYLCATIGTTSTTTVDPLKPLCDVAKDYEIWVHVDAAYAGSACICPEFQHFLYGVEGASSFSFNAHKWFFANLDCCCLWVKEPKALVQALSTSAEFLRNKATDSMEVVDYKDWQIPLSRRFRALKLWIVLRCYGVETLQNVLRSHVDMAKHFEGLVGKDKRFEAVVPRNFSLVCFRISPLAALIHRKVEGVECANDLTRKLLESINESGRIFVTHAVVGGIYVIRFAIGAPLTDYQHVEMAWKVVQQHATSILSTS